MKVELFCLCDFASSDTGGKLNIIGVFDSIRANSTPFQQGPFSIAGRARFDASETGKRQFRVRLLGPDGVDILPAAEVLVDVATPSPTHPTATAQIALGISAIQLPVFGQYSVVLEIDNAPAASLPLFVKRTEAHLLNQPQS